MYSVSWSFIELNGQLDLLFNIRIKKIKNKNQFLRWWQKKMYKCQSDVVWGQMTLHS